MTEGLANRASLTERCIFALVEEIETFEFIESRKLAFNGVPLKLYLKNKGSSSIIPIEQNMQYATGGAKWINWIRTKIRDADC